MLKKVAAKILPLGLLVSTLSYAHPQENQNGPNPTDVFIESITYGGTGCPQGTVEESISDDRETFTLIYDQFVASKGPGVPITESRKNCELSIALHVPQGFSYSIVNLENRGYVQLDANMTSTAQSAFHFAGRTKSVDFKLDFVGPVAKDYMTLNRVKVRDHVWSSCNATEALIINTQVLIEGGGANSQGQMTVDSTDGKIEHKFGIMWKRC